MSYRKKHIHPKIKKIKPKKTFYKSPLFWVIFFLTVLLVILSFMLFSPGFEVTKIRINGNQRIRQSQVENIAWPLIDKRIIGLVHYRSIFTANIDSLEKNILNDFKEIEEVEVKKKFPDEIIINIKEREPFAVFCSDQPDQKCSHIDKNGAIFGKIDNIPENALLVKKDPANEIDKNTMNAIHKIKNSLINNFQTGVKEALVSSLLILKTSENWLLYFDPKKDIDLQIAKMNLLLENEIMPKERKNLQYIYLQYEDRAYYK